MRGVLGLVVLSLALLLVAVAGERVWEQATSSRVHDHQILEDSPEFGDEVLEDEHRGIPVVEDDVPEWVKLTFADKFIALGESEFISLAEDGNADQAEYEYIYSDEEGFEFDPERDEVVSDPHKNAHHHHHHHSTDENTKHKQQASKVAASPDDDEDVQPEVKLPTIPGTKSGPSGDDQDDMVIEEEDDDIAEMVKAVRQHREAVGDSDSKETQATPSSNTNTNTNNKNNNVDNNSNNNNANSAEQASVPVSVAIHTDEPVDDSASFLQTDSTTLEKSHARGSRRAARKAQRAQQTPPRTSTTSSHAKAEPLPPQFHHPSSHQHHALPSRYANSGGSVRLNPRDPRLRRMQGEDGMVSFLDEGTNEHDALALDSETAERADRHREWLHKHHPPASQNQHGDKGKEEVELPALKRHMYSNGLPVADWEVGYVDSVLNQFGY